MFLNWTTSVTLLSIAALTCSGNRYPDSQLVHIDSEKA